MAISGPTTEAERYLRAAERIAREQGAVIFQLKAGTSLAHYWQTAAGAMKLELILDLAMTHPLDEWTGDEPARAARLRSDARLKADVFEILLSPSKKCWARSARPRRKLQNRGRRAAEEKMPDSAQGQKRRFDLGSATSDPPQSTNITRPA
jgi:hypothetical protein